MPPDGHDSADPSNAPISLGWSDLTVAAGQVVGSVIARSTALDSALRSRRLRKRDLEAARSVRTIFRVGQKEPVGGRRAETGRGLVAIKKIPFSRLKEPC